MSIKFISRHKYKLLSCLSVGFVLLTWYICVDVMGLVRPSAFPKLSKTISTFFAKFTQTAPDGATLITHFANSIKVALLGYAMGVIIGVPLGILMAWYKKVDLFVRPLFDLIRPIPGIAWIPLFILMFGIGILPMALVIFLGVLIPATVNAYTGIKQTKDVHLWVGDVFGASNMQKLFKIAIPTATPMIFTGLRVAMGSAWSALVAAELLASSSGLGYMIQIGRSISRADLVIVGMLCIGVTGAVLDEILHVIEVRVAKGMNAK